MRRAIISGLVLVACGALAPAADATFKGGNGRIAYDVHSRGIGDDGSAQSYRALSTVQTDSRRDRFLRECQIAAGAVVDGDCAIDYLTPSWSPNAKQLVFDTGRTLALIGATGTGYERLGAVTSDDSQPAFAPSGREVVFAGRSGGRSDLHVLDLRTRKARRIARDAADPDWSSRGAIAFERGGSIYSVRANGRGAKRIVRGARDPGWSASGKGLVYARKGGIYAIGADGRGARRVVRCSGCSGPVYSPDGKLIAYDDGGPRIARADTGRTVTRLVRDVSGGGERFDASNVSWGAR